MEQYFARDYSGGPFVLFDSAHLSALILIAVIAVSFFFARKLWSESTRRTFRYFMAGWLFVWELSWHLWNLYWGTWTIQTMLPLHLCSVMVWISIYMLVTKNYSIFEVTYFLGIGGALQALLTPDAGIYGFPHFRAFQTFASHGGIVLASLYMAVVEGYRPTLKSFKRVLIWTNIYMVCVFFINLAIGSNYLFIAHKPEFPTLIDALAPWPWYILELEVIAFVILGVMYLPYLFMDLRRERAEPAAQA
jgi:hypothetical integral membrane protein (TIGR02206 family)